MRVFHDVQAAGVELDRPYVTIGNYDGLHAGHARVLARLRERAGEAPTLVVTFRPHPAALLSDAGAPARLLSDAQQREILESLGLSGLLLQPFDADLARLAPEDFHARFLVGALRARGLVVGQAFRFGAHRRGDLALLERLASQPDALTEAGSPLVIEGVPALMAGGAVVSSSRIRELVQQGSVEEAEALIGRPFVLEGRVVHGDGRGRLLGFPTANIEPLQVMLPAPGVYACILRRDDELLPAVANVGRRPTFAPRAVGVEAHVLDFSGTLYGDVVRLAFVKRLRDEARFAGADELVRQLGQDVLAARSVLAARPPSSLAGVPGT